MQYLKQSTAKTFRIGPFLDDTDGKTAETGLTIAQANVRISKDGAAFAQKNDATSCTHDENGWYSVVLNTTDTNTLGHLVLNVSMSGALPVWREFMVVPANAYDSLFGTDKLEVDTTQWDGTNVATPNTAGVPVIDMVRINGGLTNDHNATLSLKKLDIENNNGDALSAVSTGGNGDGAKFSGNGSGAGSRHLGGATSDPNNAGIFAQSNGAGCPGIHGDGGTNGDGMALIGDGTGSGLKLTKGASGKAINADEIDNMPTAVWSAGTRTLTSFGSLVSDITTAVWSAGTRTLTSFGTLVADVATAVWGAAARTLTSFGTLVSDIDAQLTSSHGSGSWVSDWTSGEKEQVRDALGVTGTKTTATGGQLQSIETKIDTVDTVADAIKIKTDNLPADPASETNVDAVKTKVDTAITDIAAVQSTADSIETKVDAVDTVVDAIKAKTDNLPADPASESNVDAVEAKVDIVDTNVDAVLVDTGTTLPAALSVIDGKINVIDTNVDAILVDTSNTLDNKLDAIISDITDGTYGLAALQSDLAAVGLDVDAIVAKLPSGTISDLALSDTVDGITLTTIYELVMAMVNGRYRIDYPSLGQVTFYKRDNSTELFTVSVTETERARV